MADGNARASRSDEGDSDDMSILLHHLLSTSSAPSPIPSGKGCGIPFQLPLPSSDAALSLAARRAAAGVAPASVACGWEIFSNAKALDGGDRSGTCQRHLPDRDRTTSTAESSAASLVLPHAGEARDRRSSFMDSSGECDAGSGKRRKAASSSGEANFDEYDCESEAGVEASEEFSRPAPARTASKRSRAAEVHNLSEKRRRSRINEKMKALQNLIPNSNKTDKASMLDEAIDYLKQLQLQVQMLSRNGLSLHPLYLPGSLQPMQIPRMSMSFGTGNGSLHLNMGMGMPHMKQDPSTSSFEISNPSIPSNQSPLIRSIPNVTVTSEAFSDLSQPHHGPFQLSAVSEETYRDGIIAQEVHASHSMKYQSGGPSN